MSDFLLKDMYSPAFFSRFSDLLSDMMPGFDQVKFQEMIFVGNWEQKSLKERLKHTAAVLHHFLPQNFIQATEVIDRLVFRLRAGEMASGTLGFEFMFIPDYIETYGLDDYDTAVRSIETVTQFTSCEFAVRPFILKYGEPMIRQMQEWSKHESSLVRRLSSEGIRPRLPWAMALPELKKNPAAILPILENLKNDPDESVRRSVANNLNDIAKDNPHVVVEIAKRWNGVSRETDAIVKHGCRTLLKQGHAEILDLYGLVCDELDVCGFRIQTPVVPMGNEVVFSFAIKNKSLETKMIRIEYAIYYLRQRGVLSKKVFKISERIWQPGEENTVTKKHSFREITTRRFYPGRQQLSVIVNGQEKESGYFDLKE